MNIRDAVVLELLSFLDDVIERGDELAQKSRGEKPKKEIPGMVYGDARLQRAHLLDEIGASMTEPQKELLKRWRGYVCPKCKHTMIANVESKPEDWP